MLSFSRYWPLNIVIFNIWNDVAGERLKIEQNGLYVPILILFQIYRMMVFWKFLKVPSYHKIDLN